DWAVGQLVYSITVQQPEADRGLPRLVWRPNGPGTGLFSRGLVTPVSWALERFTTVFGMGTGGTTPLSPPGPIGRHASNVFSASKLSRQYIGPLAVPLLVWRGAPEADRGCQRTWILPT